MDKAIPQDDMVVIEPEDCEVYKLEGGFMLIGRIDPFVSQGFLDLEAGKQFLGGSFRAKGMLKQVTGESEAGLAGKPMPMKEGDTIQLPAGEGFSIRNSGSGRGVVYWRFDGDVVSELEKVRGEPVPARKREASGYKELWEAYQQRMQEKQGDY